MTPTTWLTIFLALVALSILIQAGIMLGLYLGMRRMENLFNRWEPVLLQKIGPITAVVEEKARVYADKAGRLIDHLAVYAQRLSSGVSTQLDQAGRTIETVEHRFMQPLAAVIPGKKKRESRRPLPPRIL